MARLMTGHFSFENRPVWWADGACPSVILEPVLPRWALYVASLPQANGSLTRMVGTSNPSAQSDCRLRVRPGRGTAFVHRGSTAGFRVALEGIAVFQPGGQWTERSFKVVGDAANVVRIELKDLR